MSDRIGMDERTRTSLGRRDLLLAAVLTVLVFLVYQPAWHGGFLWDDAAHVTRPELRSWQGLFRIWFDLGATQQYYPLLHSAFWVQHRLWGDATLGYHLVNILLHCVAALLVLRTLRGLAVPGACLAAAIFALHPVHVESVAWISELKNTLSAVFYLSSLLLYLDFDRTRRPAPYAAALFLFTLGLLSKTVTATLPGALLVLAWWRRGEIGWRRDVLPTLPMFALGALAGAFTAWVELKLIGAEGAAFEMSVVERLLLAGRALWFYAAKLFWPSHLLFNYPRWTIDQAAAPQYVFPLGAVLVVGGLWSQRRRSRAPLAGALFFAGTLFPVLGFFNVYPFVYSFVADHFQYLASLGVIAPTSAGFTLLANRLGKQRQRIARGLALALLAALATLTWRQSCMYADIETLYRTTIARNPEGSLAYTNLGNLLLGKGRLNEATDLYQRALRVKPDLAEAHSNLGLALAGRGRTDEAIAHYKEALRIRPAYVEAHNNLGLALAGLGQLQEAASQYREALALNPRAAEPHNNLGLALARLGHYDEAIAHFEQALEISPGFSHARVNLAWARSARQNRR